jgi:16S rRNA (guanine527-N7)-methyltransferase
VEESVDKSTYTYLLNIYNSNIDVVGGSFETLLERFKRYQLLLKNWTYKVNLVSDSDVENLWKKHFLPSLMPLELMLIPNNSMCLDAGSGAGLPGIPIKLFRPDIHLDLCEANRKKSLFLTEVIKALDLRQAKVYNERIEMIADKYDLIFSRALGKPDYVFDMLKDKLNPGGFILIWTSKSYSRKIKNCIEKSFDIPHSGKLLKLTPGNFQP